MGEISVIQGNRQECLFYRSPCFLVAQTLLSAPIDAKFTCFPRTAFRNTPNTLQSALVLAIRHYLRTIAPFF